MCLPTGLLRGGGEGLGCQYHGAPGWAWLRNTPSVPGARHSCLPLPFQPSPCIWFCRLSPQVRATAMSPPGAPGAVLSPFFHLASFSQRSVALHTLLSHAMAISPSSFGDLGIFVLPFRATPSAYGSSQARGQIELQLPAYTTATTMQDPSCLCDLHHSPRQRQILHPLIEARDRTHNPMVMSQFHFL